MHAPASAEEDLRVIRGLMERATVYRDISAPSALIAGLLSSAAAGAVYFNNQRQILLGRAIRPREFAGIWLVVLLVSVIASAFFLWHSAKNSGRPFVSSGMRAYP